MPPTRLFVGKGLEKVGMNGYELCRRLRSTTLAPILFLSSRDTEFDKISAGLEVGADDYLVKPFGLRELIARVRALLRRESWTTAANEDTVIAAGALTLDVNARTVTGDAGEIDLSRLEFDLLAYLMKNAEKVVSRDDLLRDIWDWKCPTETTMVETHIKRLRRKIKCAGYNPNLIVTVRGCGYKFKA